MRIGWYQRIYIYGDGGRPKGTPNPNPNPNPNPKTLLLKPEPGV